MQCPRCQFENIPGQKVCFRCGSVLEDAQPAVEVHPPRASRFSKFFRPMRYAVRRRTGLRKLEDAAGEAASRGLDVMGVRRAGRPGGGEAREARRFAGVVLKGLILSIVPGLAHLAQGRLWDIRFTWPAWLAALFVGLFFYGGNLGAATIGIAIVLHAWIAADAALLLKVVKRLGFYLTALFGVGIGVLALYMAVNAYLLGAFQGGPAAVAVPFHEIQLRDYILCRRLPADPASELHRGDMVLVTGVSVIRNRPRYRLLTERLPFVARPVGETVGQLIGLPGDVVSLRDGAFHVNGVRRDRDRMPVPEWLDDLSASLTLGEDDYFVSLEYTGGVRGGQALLREACVFGRGRVAARGVMLWLPIQRRRTLREIE